MLHPLTTPPLCRPVSLAKFHSTRQLDLQRHRTQFQNDLSRSRRCGETLPILASWRGCLCGRNSPICNMYNVAIAGPLGWVDSCVFCHLSPRRRLYVSSIVFRVGSSPERNCEVKLGTRCILQEHKVGPMVSSSIWPGIDTCSGQCLGGLCTGHIFSRELRNSLASGDTSNELHYS